MGYQIKYLPIRCLFNINPFFCKIFFNDISIIRIKIRQETFVVPEAKIEEQVMTIPGTDGQKMSKSYGNIIDIFLPEKALRKQIMRMTLMAIKGPLKLHKSSTLQEY